MPPVTPGSSSDSEQNLAFFAIPQSLLLQVGTASILLLQIGEKATTETIQAFGEATEELFRGDRLPILNFPDDHES
ncbi:hypothetical protein [Brasilonema bromeliae]|uniref:Uncharacterized protein n=1 Tax=Brasilonema bromeliae SPC951 TaxID=385972 RepID=A0ABX1PAI9_9CYAN|nr:hypothetical protein [Brasilonema bromeliae]NMG20988.1 hypothetical protein [Brasilonema bromeliae SPC951]